MNESQYHQLLDDLMFAIEDAIDESGLDIDYETSAGILTLSLENNSKVILSRQTVMLQLWVAAKSGGYHFDYKAEQENWICDSTGEELMVLLNRCLSEQSGETVELALG